MEPYKRTHCRRGRGKERDVFIVPILDAAGNEIGIRANGCDDADGSAACSQCCKDVLREFLEIIKQDSASE